MNSSLCIVASQRSGTTSLRETLAATGNCADFGEIFHNDTTLWPGAYFAFAQARRLAVADLVTGEQARNVASDYLDYLQELAGDRAPVLDVKFNSWGVISSAWSHPHQRPLFMDVLSQRGALFLFIRRRDVAAQVMSEQIARMAGKWHKQAEDDLPAEVRLDPWRAAERARLVVLSEALFLHHLDRLPQGSEHLSIDYEDLYRDGGLNPELTDRLASRLGVELPPPLAPLTGPNAIDKARTVANHAEVSLAVQAAIAGLPRPEPARRIA